MMGDLTRWVIDAALRQARAWQDEGIEVPIAINLAAANILDAALPDAVAERLAHHGVPGERLTCEISEHTVMADPRRATEVLERLRALGVRLSLDDFGTGQSLARLPQAAAARRGQDRPRLRLRHGRRHERRADRALHDRPRPRPRARGRRRGRRGRGGPRAPARAALPRGAGLPPLAAAAARGARGLARRARVARSHGRADQRDQRCTRGTSAACSAGRHVRRGVPRRVVRHAELRGDLARERELAVVGEALARVGDPADVGGRCASRRARCAAPARGGAASAATSCGRGRPRRARAPSAGRPCACGGCGAPAPSRRGGRAARCGSAPRRRWRRARRRSAAAAPRAAARAPTSVPTPGGVVLGARRGRDRVGVGHDHEQAVARRVVGADHVARAAEAGDAERVAVDVEAGAAEARRRALVGAALERPGGGTRAGEGERAGEPVRRVARGIGRRAARASPPAAAARSSGPDRELARAGAEAEREQRLLPGRADHRLAVDLLEREPADAAALDRRRRAPRSRASAARRPSSTRICRPLPPRST